MAGYTQKTGEEKKSITARAIGREMNISPKHSVEICTALRGKTVERAKEYLEEVIELKRAVPFKKYNTMVPHRKGKVGPGRYPQKAANAILKVIVSAQANAEYGLDPGINSEKMKIITISASLGKLTPGWMPRAHGRASPFNHESVNVEIILEAAEEEEQE